MRTTVCSLAVLVAASGLAACDFTPTLDIETPEYEAGVAVRGFLVADSVTVIRLSESWNPYEGRLSNNRRYRPETIPAVVTLLRGGDVVEVLTVQSETCEDYGEYDPTNPNPLPTFYECGPYGGTVPIEAGATYTLRVETADLPTAEATVVVPRRPSLDVAEEAGGADAPRRFRVRLGDPPGAGDLYGLSLLRTDQVFYSYECDENGVCRDTTFVTPGVGRFLTSFETSDPVLVAAAREFDENITFASFPDDTFEGSEKTFTISPSRNYGEATEGGFIVQVAALSADIYDTYQISYFGGGDDNPFAEPANLPSNVEGGYGLVGGVALAEAVIGRRE